MYDYFLATEKQEAHDRGFMKGIWFTVAVQSFILIACKVIL